MDRSISVSPASVLESIYFTDGVQPTKINYGVEQTAKQINPFVSQTSLSEEDGIIKKQYYIVKEDGRGVNRVYLRVAFYDSYPKGFSIDTDIALDYAQFDDGSIAKIGTLFMDWNQDLGKFICENYQIYDSTSFKLYLIKSCYV
jgi:hypothetical protein